MNDPWAIIGDFNSTLSSQDRMGGSQNPSQRGCDDFRGMVQNCNLVDAGFQGPPFTWQMGNLSIRLDRMFINIQWRLLFQDGVVFHLPKFKSNHRCILVRMKKEKPVNSHRRPFRFMASWLSHDDFPRVMSQNWLENLCWGDQMINLQNALRQWNRDVFGNIFKRKKKTFKET